MEYRHVKPKISDKELLEIFPEAKEIIQSNISELQKVIKQKESKIKNLLQHIYLLKSDAFSEWYAEELIKIFIMPKLQIYNSRLLRLMRMQLIINPNKSNSSFKLQDNIERARAYPIFELARSKLELLERGQNFVCCCPFHAEKTPSFYLYAKNNTYHCYGCQAHGDVIKLTMELYGINFKEAVKMLRN